MQSGVGGKGVDVPTNRGHGGLQLWGEWQAAETYDKVGSWKDQERVCCATGCWQCTPLREPRGPGGG